MLKVPYKKSRSKNYYKQIIIPIAKPNVFVILSRIKFNRETFNKSFMRFISEAPKLF